MRATSLAAIGGVIATTLAAWALANLTSHVSALQAQLTAVEKRLDAGVMLAPKQSASARPAVGSPASDSGGDTPPVPPRVESARTSDAQLQLVAWIEAYVEANLALGRRDALRQTSTMLPSEAHGLSQWQDALGENAATEEIAARLAIQRAKDARARFEATNK